MRHVLGMVFGVVCLLAGAVYAETSFDESRPAKADGVVALANVAGSVRVSTWDNAEIHVSGTLEENVERVSFEVHDGRANVKVHLKRDAHKNTAAHLTIQAPRLSRLQIATVSADVVVNPAEASAGAQAPQPAAQSAVAAAGTELPEAVPESVEVCTVSGGVHLLSAAREASIETVSGGIDAEVGANRAEVKTVSGDVTLTGWAHEARVASVSGVLRIDAVVDSLEATSVSGGIFAAKVRRDAELSTTSGGVTLNGDALETAEIGTISGKVDISVALAPEGNLDIGTTSGNVALHLPKGVASEFALTTASGRLDVNVSGNAPSAGMPGETVRFSTGTGAALVAVETQSGDITVDEK